MSSISSLTNNPLDPYSLLTLNGQDPTQTSSATASTAGTTDLTDSTDSTQSTESSGGHHHHKGGGIPSKIESAVTTALQNAPTGTDPNQTIQDAIAAVLKQGESGSNPSQSSTTTDPNGSTSPSDFKQLLQSFNIDPKQFQQDFQAAVKNVQSDGSGSVDFGTLFQNFPPGTAVNTIA